MRQFITGLTILIVLASSRSGFTHDDGKALDNQPRYEGPGFNGVSGAPPVEFNSSGVNLEAWVPLGDFDALIGATVSRANDIWGYVSPSGREYAIVGLGNGIGFVEVTSPDMPQIVAAFSGPGSIWRDVKVFQDHAYVVGDGGVPNIEVYDLSQIDNGQVTHPTSVITGSTHNVVIDTTSGYLYRTGSNGGGEAKGLMIYDLNPNPASPTLAGQWGSRYIHDAQAVTYTSGPLAGKQVVFAFAEDGGGGGNPALDILDVTDKSDIQLMDRVVYSDSNYSHQGWLSPDARYVYIDDELDELYDPDITTTTTRIVNVEDPYDAFEVGTYTNGNTAIDHNQYTRFHLIMASNYRSGLRVFDASDPEAPVEIAFFDTYPTDDNANFNGLWSNFPYFPSGTVLGSDIEKGLFVWSVDALSQVTSGDVNGDGQTDAGDIDLVFSALAAGVGNLKFDLDEDGMITSADVDHLVQVDLGSYYGDANLDGIVSLADLDLLGQNYGAVTGWSGGDFSGDGLASLADLDLMGLNWGAGTPSIAAVPEPSAVTLSLLAILTGGACLRLRRLS